MDGSMTEFTKRQLALARDLRESADAALERGDQDYAFDLYDSADVIEKNNK